MRHASDACARPCALLAAALTLILAAGCEKRTRAPAERDSAGQAPTVITTKTGVPMVRLPGGQFTMGSDDRDQVDEPPHRVAVSPFLIDCYEVTQQSYEQVMGVNPSKWKNPTNPVEQIRWADAARYCNARSHLEALQPAYDPKTWSCDVEADGYRLPTEAEWEYACRAGTETTYSFGNDYSALKAHAWFKGNAARGPRPVGAREPNPWGLHDMAGNVWEWCHDLYAEDYYLRSPKQDPSGPVAGEQRVLRGGCWNSRPDMCRSAYRHNEDPGYTDVCFGADVHGFVGFRCVRRLPHGKGSATQKTGNASAKTGLVYSDIYLRHDAGPGHPERPERLSAIVTNLEQTGLLSELVLLEPTTAAPEWLTTVHTAAYITRVKDVCLAGTGYVDTPDAPASRESYDVAVAAVGGVLTAIDAVMDGRARNAFCAVRPPGHHALRDKAMGFCLFNNVAIGARYIQKRHKLRKVLIVDWDVHHGNGTQATFAEDPTVFYFGTHQHPLYPGTGSARERGEGEGAGTVLNVPLPAGSGDAELRQAFEEKLRPAALAFRPDFILISAGFDAHEHDLLGGMNLTPAGFAALTRIVKALADECCGGRIVSVLEGGYGLAGLAASVEAHIRALMG